MLVEICKAIGFMAVGAGITNVIYQYWIDKMLIDIEKSIEKMEENP